MRPSDIVVKETQIIYEPQQARTPLKFGGVVVEHVIFCRVRLTVENRRGDVADGWGGIFLMDFWGWPDASLSHEDKERAMAQVTESFTDAVADYSTPAHPIDIFMDLEPELARINSRVCAEAGLSPEQPFLGALVCASPV
ncbi:MAG: hypothetical protein J7M38_03795, partial [Armatimonadetes bacterium]|nr:hypothetical protein [Armatimonadota bacterium]